MLLLCTLFIIYHMTPTKVDLTYLRLLTNNAYCIADVGGRARRNVGRKGTSKKGIGEIGKV